MVDVLNPVQWERPEVKRINDLSPPRRGGYLWPRCYIDDKSFTLGNVPLEDERRVQLNGLEVPWEGLKGGERY